MLAITLLWNQVSGTHSRKKYFFRTAAEAAVFERQTNFCCADPGLLKSVSEKTTLLKNQDFYGSV